MQTSKAAMTRSRMKMSVAAVLVVVPVVLLVYLRHGSMWEAATEIQQGVYASKEDAAYAEGTSHRSPATELFSLEAGSSVSVLWDTYGKDYWACYVRAESGARGWVLCTDLQRK